MIRITTVSGSIYDFDTDEMLMRRSNPTDKLRKDDLWLPFFGIYKQAQIGESLVIFMEPLQDNWADTTVRMTTAVSNIEEVND